MRKLTCLLVAIIGANYARADIPAPPPEQGTKYVNLHNSVVLDKSVTGFVFVVEVGHGPGPPKKSYSSVSLSERPTAMPLGGKYTSVNLLAIPQAEAKKFAAEANLHATLEKGAVPGVSRMPFVSTGVASTKHRPDTINCTYTITGFDEQRGLIWQTVREDQKTGVEASSSQPLATEELHYQHEAEPIVSDQTRMIIVGTCLTLAVIGVGLWLTTRLGKQPEASGQ